MTEVESGVHDIRVYVHSRTMCPSCLYIVSVSALVGGPESGGHLPDTAADRVLRLLGHLDISTASSGGTTSVPIQGGIEHHDSRSLTKHAPNESEEDILVPEQSQWSTRRDKNNGKPDVDIELASVVTTSRMGKS
jgi:hypothetical protein